MDSCKAETAQLMPSLYTSWPSIIFSVKPDLGTAFSQGRRAACANEWQCGIGLSHGGVHVKQ